MEMMTIGEFAQRTRLSQKALRLYDRLGLLTPARTDLNSGYRLYAENQIGQARLIGLLRRIDMPLPAIADALTKPPDQAADAVGEYWEGIESVTAERRALVFYIQARLTGANVPAYNIETRTIPDRSVAAIHRHVHANQTNSFFVDAFARLRAVGDGLEGIEGVPFVIFYGEVSDDSDGPIELCRPIATLTNSCRQPGNHDPDIRVEPAHEEAYIRLAKNEIGWPAMHPACDALEAWTSEHNRQPAGPPRQVLIADQRTATPDTPVCDLSLPLKPRPQ